MVEIETDKVNMEVEAMGGGVLRKILIDAGKVVPVGELLAVIAKRTRIFPRCSRAEAPASRVARPPRRQLAPAPRIRSRRDTPAGAGSADPEAWPDAA